MEINVKIHSIGETNVVSDKFRKREFIVVTSEQYPAHLGLQMIQDKCDILNEYQVGQDVKVHLNIKGRLWMNKEGVEVAFNTLECWRIEKDVLGSLSPQPGGVPANNPKQVASGEDEPDGLPF